MSLYRWGLFIAQSNHKICLYGDFIITARNEVGAMLCVACVVSQGCAWLLGGMHGSQGACMVAGGHAWLLGVCVVARECVWLLGGMCGCQGACVVARGMHGCRGACMVVSGCARLSGSMHGCQGACMVAGGHGCQGACMARGGGLIGKRGVCMAKGGMCGKGGHAWDTMRYGDTINEQPVHILLECILVLIYITILNFVNCE